MTEEEPELLACEEIQAQVDVKISQFSGKPESVVLPMGVLFNSYQFHNKHYGFTLEGDLTVYGGYGKDIVIQRDK